MIRETDPDNRRCKKVSLTEAGRELVAAIDSVDNPAPDLMRSLSEADLAALQEILRKTARG